MKIIETANKSLKQIYDELDKLSLEELIDICLFSSLSKSDKDFYINII